LKASVKRKFDKADDLNWKLLQLEIKLKKLDEIIRVSKTRGRTIASVDMTVDRNFPVKYR
jgi:hypothetical protein